MCAEAYKDAKITKLWNF